MQQHSLQHSLFVIQQDTFPRIRVFEFSFKLIPQEELQIQIFTSPENKFQTSIDYLQLFTSPTFIQSSSILNVTCLVREKYEIRSKKSERDNISPPSFYPYITLSKLHPRSNTPVHHPPTRAFSRAKDAIRKSGGHGKVVHFPPADTYLRLMSVHGDAGEDTRGGGREKEVTSRGRERERGREEVGAGRESRKEWRSGWVGWTEGGWWRRVGESIAILHRLEIDTGDRGIETTALCCCLSVVFFFARDVERRAWPPSRDDEFIRNVFWKRERLTVFQRFQQSMVKES